MPWSISSGAWGGAGREEGLLGSEEAFGGRQTAHVGVRVREQGLLCGVAGRRWRICPKPLGRSWQLVKMTGSPPCPPQDALSANS